MYSVHEIDWDAIREELFQKEYEEEMQRLREAYQIAAADNDTEKMDAIQKQMEAL
ncbi:hypothetical protein J6TS7_29280 [Paenibacillus dendritiformis]|uniref:hypothetical protein n=1 Tax=Paenibacillus TaxID=44249 RepID=UPI001B152FDD|nr:hypothetical protein [Paenibacillus dendritiformis]GIO79318.1 hypothetical protein J6TS7_29280 [Paenibacillus dendritiformis]